MNCKNGTFIGILLLWMSVSLHALDGMLDATFNPRSGHAGMIASSFGSHATIKALEVQHDGKMVAAGYINESGNNRFAVFRYNPDGSLDATFGNAGSITTKFGLNETISGAQAIMVQADGKIVVGGFTNAVKNKFAWCLARYNHNGALDESFFGGRAIIGGTVITDFGVADHGAQLQALALQSDGKIVAVGTCGWGAGPSRAAVARYHTNGSLDAQEFNAAGVGSIAGTRVFSFGDYDACCDQAHALAIQSNGRMVIAGNSTVTGVQTFALARLHTNGDLDRSFLNGASRVPGTVITSFAWGETHAGATSVVVQSDGKIVAAGYTNSNSPDQLMTRFALARYDWQGNLDAGFGGYGLACIAGTVITGFEAEQRSLAHALIIQPDGKLVAAGMVHMAGTEYSALVRYMSDGNLDNAFQSRGASAGKVISALPESNNNTLYSVALQTNGSIVAAGKAYKHGTHQALLTRHTSTRSQMAGPIIQFPGNEGIIVDGSAICVKGTAHTSGIIHLYLDNTYIDSIATHGPSNEWEYTLPSMASGNYQIRAQQHCPGAKLSLASVPVAFTIDQIPIALDGMIATCGMNPVTDFLRAQGASGDYSFSIVSAVHGEVSLVDDQYTFAPTIASGEGLFTFQVRDNRTGGTSRGTITITIHELPQISPTQVIVCQDRTLTGSLQSAITGDAPPFIFSLVGDCSGGSVQLSSDGTYTFVPKLGFTGLATFEYQVRDKNGGISVPTKANIIVTPLPIAREATFLVYEGSTLNESLVPLVAQASGPYTFHKCGIENNKFLSCRLQLALDGSFSYTPPQGYEGKHTFKYRIVDTYKNISKPALITIQIQRLPIAIGMQITSVKDKIVLGNLALRASKGVPPYTYEPGINAINCAVYIDRYTGDFRCTPSHDFIGTASFDYHVIDSNGARSKPATVMITIYEDFTLNPLAAFTSQDRAIRGNLSTQVIGGALPYSFDLNDGPKHGIVNLGRDGAFTFTPHTGFVGQTNFEYTMQDNNGIENRSSVTIDVHERPAVLSRAISMYEESMIQNSLAAQICKGCAPLIFGLENPSDDGLVNLYTDGTFVFAPKVGFNGTTQFSYKVTDKYHGVSEPAILKLTVNTLPVASNVTLTTQENTPIKSNIFASLIRGSVAPFKYAITKLPSYGDLHIEEDGAFVYQPHMDYAGSDSCEFLFVDNNHVTSNICTLTFIVHQLPKVKDLTDINLQQGTPVALNLNSLASGGNPPYTFTLVKSSDMENTQLTTDGSLTYACAPDFTGELTISYQVSDALNNQSKVGHAIVGVHAAPTVEYLSFSAFANTPLDACLINSIRAGHAPYTFTLDKQATFGNVTVAPDGAFTYIPNADYLGNDSFAYTVTDRYGHSAHGVVTMALYKKVRAQDITLMSTCNTALNGCLKSYVESGSKPYLFSLVGHVRDGAVSIDADGTFIFNPAPDFVGTTQFTYKVTDIHQSTMQGTVTVIINEGSPGCE